MLPRRPRTELRALYLSRLGPRSLVASGRSHAREGVVSVSGGKVTIGDKTEEIKNEGSGVTPEVRAWGEALAAGKVNERQSPEEALADLEIIEASLRSGEQGGKPIALECQTW